MKNLVSIITPFHNTDLDSFKMSFDSVIGQTMKPSKYEYIIVLHNCEQKYITGVKKIVKGHKNIKLLLLKNNSHSPSSPRNYGLKHATGEYICFLDSDDALYPNTLEYVYEASKSENVDITAFRFDNVIEDKKEIVEIYQTCLFDQTKEKILLTKNNYDQSQLMSAPFLTVHTKFYRLKFIQDNNLYLNEDVPNAEDVLYNTGAIGLADRILILPQFIGYCYYQHVGSTCQTYKRSNEQILQLATSATLACEQGWKYGVYIDDVALSLFGACNLTILASDTDYETVKKASDIAKPYLDKLHKPIVTKFSDEKTIKRITSLANLVYRHPRLTMLVKKILKARNIDFEKMAKERN